MSEEISLVKSQETIFFGNHEGELRQWISVDIESKSEKQAEGTVTLTAGGEHVTTRVTLRPGKASYRIYAPVLWPDRKPEPEAQIILKCGGTEVRGKCPVGHHRPWVIYALADVCTDATWVYDNTEDMRKDDADLTAAELLLNEVTQGAADANINRYNLVHAVELEYFEEHYPELTGRLAEAMSRDEITLNPFYNMTLTLNISLEEQIRLFYKAREWAEKYGLSIRYANHQETPNIAWNLADVMADCGIGYLVKGILPYECPWAARLVEPPIFLWEGPDGSQVKMRRRNIDYVEGYCLIEGLEKTNQKLHEQTIPEYEAWGERYPFNAVGLVGVYGDLIPAERGKRQSRDLPLIKATTITRYNNQEWEYPRLVNASHAQFWQEIDRQIADRDIHLEVSRGDYGIGWDVWPACLAYDVAGWREAQRRSYTADGLAAIINILDKRWYSENKAELGNGWKNLKMLADHAWNGANDANRELNASLRREWQTKANRAFAKVIKSGLQTLAEKVKADGKDQWLVYNSLGWVRNGLVEIASTEKGKTIVDVQTNQVLRSQYDHETGNTYVLLPEIPSVGYRTIKINEYCGGAVDTPFRYYENGFEGPYYRIEFSPRTGGIIHLFDKVRMKELVNPESGYHINQLVYFVGGPIDPNRAYPLLHPPKVDQGKEQTPANATVTAGKSGPLFAEMVVTTEIEGIRLKSTVRIYADFDRIDIRNEVHKEVSTERQQMDFVFPLQIPDREYRLEQPGVIVDPEREMLPGAGLSAGVVRHFVDVFNSEHGVTLTLHDSFAIQFGRRTTTEDPQRIDDSATIYALALGNIYDANEAIHDQAGARDFIFRFSISGHVGGFNAEGAVRRSWEAVFPLEVVHIADSNDGSLPPASDFLSISPANVLLAGCKPAEDGDDGLVARLWEVGQLDCSAQITANIPRKLQRMVRIDHLERKQAPSVDGVTRIPVKARGVISTKLEW